MTINRAAATHSPPAQSVGSNVREYLLIGGYQYNLGGSGENAGQRAIEHCFPRISKSPGSAARGFFASRIHDVCIRRDHFFFSALGGSRMPAVRASRSGNGGILEIGFAWYQNAVLHQSSLRSKRPSLRQPICWMVALIVLVK